MQSFRFCSLILFIAIYFSENVNGQDQITPADKARAIFFYGIEPRPCTARYGSLLFEGFCDTLSSCMVNRGMKVGFCQGGPVCCLITATCGSTFSSKFGYFLNEDYSIQSTTASTSPYCEVKVRKYDTKTCQIRLDLEEFEINEPDITGGCEEGFLEVMGTDPNYKIPKLCGANSDQHMYLSYPSFGGEISLRIKATLSKWKIKITQIECIPESEPEPAPAGCLQYFTDDTATITSFNYDADVPKQLKDLDYEVCVEKESVHCNVTWTATSFKMSTGQNIEPLYNGCPIAGEACLIEENYINVLIGTRQPVLGGCLSRNERINNLFCGSATTSVLGEVQEFDIATPSPRMQVVTSKTDTGPTAGFRMQYEKMC